MVRKNSKKLQSCFKYGFAEKFFKQKRPECPFKQGRAKAAPNPPVGGGAPAKMGAPLFTLQLLL